MMSFQSSITFQTFDVEASSWMIGFYEKPHLCILEIKGTFNFWIGLLAMHEDRDLGSMYGVVRKADKEF